MSESQIKSVTNKTEKYFPTVNFDSKGRSVGYIVHTDEAVTVPEYEDGLGYLPLPPGNYLRARVQTTRNGLAFGATQGWEWFTTEGERQRWLSEKLAKVMK